MTREELTKDVVGYEGIYTIDIFGNVVRTKDGKEVPQQMNKFGYMNVSLYKDGKQKQHKVHRLIAQAFILNPQNKEQVNHIDGNKAHNVVWNLEWCTPSQNMMHCHANGLSDWNTNVRVIETDRVYRSIAECARDIGGYEQLIRECLDGKRKTHKGYHFERIGKRASDKHKRNNYCQKNRVYEPTITAEYNGEIRTLKEWSELYGIKRHTLECRYYRGDRGKRLFREVRKRG